MLHKLINREGFIKGAKGKDNGYGLAEFKHDVKMKVFALERIELVLFALHNRPITANSSTNFKAIREWSDKKGNATWDELVVRHSFDFYLS